MNRLTPVRFRPLLRTRILRPALVRPPCLSRATPARWHSTNKHSPIPTGEAPSSSIPSTAATLSASEYERLSSETMDTLYDALEALVEEWSPEGTHNWEVEYSAGVLTLGLGPHGTYVINKQPPNQQIWLSSPFSGPARFSYVPPSTRTEAGKWIYARDGVSLGTLLDQEVRSVLDAEVGKADAAEWPGVGVQ